jgi:hypothetical protein
MSEVTQWSHLWTDLDRYVLVRTKYAGHAIVDTKMKAAIVIEDDALREKVVRQMLSAGSLVLEKFPT